MDQHPAQRIVIHIFGVVQGVGFRPFAARLARALNVNGLVRNRCGHVEIEAVATPEALHLFLAGLAAQNPPGSHIQTIHHEQKPFAPDEAAPQAFEIVPSGASGGGAVMPSPDLPVCPDCARELCSPGDPRYRNPFISCTHCGPRFSIMRSVPYDRPETSMRRFPLCPLCEAQYKDPEDRRYHAQTICCNACGPTLRYRDRAAEDASGERALRAAVRALRGSGIVAVKGIGGYHLACSPFDAFAVRRLRALKGREAKPFAVMFSDMAEILRHCAPSPSEQDLLQSAARPIVPVRRREDSTVDPGVYADSAELGAFLPYTPLQLLLLAETGPLIMTSANPSSLPIVHADADMLSFFAEQPSLCGVLSHDRDILRRLDDSVQSVVLGEPTMIRRARGYVPLALPVTPAGPPLLAVGPQQKNTVCYARDGLAFLSAEHGDLFSIEAEAAYRASVQDFGALLGVRPEMVVRDLHPEYTSTRIADEMGLPVCAVQHHHAHIASVMAEHQLHRPVLGVAFDGTGYGTDGTVWGGEFLLVSPDGFTRLGHLKAVEMLGGDASVPQGWKSAACMRRDAGLPPREGDRLVYAALDHRVNTILSSSMGRLFDAASALLGICETSRYDGHGAIALERAAARYAGTHDEEAAPLPYTLGEYGGELIADFAPCIRSLEAEAEKGAAAEALAWRFHLTVADFIENACLRLSARSGIRAVALSGGVFHNRLLTERTALRLRGAGLSVYLNRRVPAGDGGIALGQAQAALWEIEKKR